LAHPSGGDGSGTSCAVRSVIRRDTRQKAVRRGTSAHCDETARDARWAGTARGQRAANSELPAPPCPHAAAALRAANRLLRTLPVAHSIWRLSGGALGNGWGARYTRTRCPRRSSCTATRRRDEWKSGQRSNAAVRCGYCTARSHAR
jgi:hypothetical protein